MFSHHSHTVTVELPDGTSHFVTCTGQTTIQDLRVDEPVEDTDHVPLLTDDTGYRHRVTNDTRIDEYLAASGELEFVRPHEV